jgi:hypothetical protein
MLGPVPGMEVFMDAVERAFAGLFLTGLLGVYLGVGYLLFFK